MYRSSYVTVKVHKRAQVRHATPATRMRALRRSSPPQWGGSGTGAVSAGSGPFPVPARQTVHAVLPHTAYRRSSPSAFGLPAPGPEGPGRDDGPIKDDQAQMVRG